MKASQAGVVLPDGRVLLLHGGTRGMTFTLITEGESQEFVTLPDLATVDMVLAGIQRCRRGIAAAMDGDGLR